MDRNVCGLDRIARLVVGPALAFAALRLGRDATAQSATRRLAGLGAVLWGLEITLTGLVQWCPLNHALGVDTCERGWVERYRDAFGPAREEGAATARSASGRW